MEIKVELTDRETEHIAKLLNQYGALAENQGDRNTMGLARTAARDLLDRLTNVRAAAGLDATRQANQSPVKDFKHPAEKSMEQRKSEKWGVGEKTADGATRFVTHAGIGDLIWVIQLFTSLARRWGETIEICPVGMGIKRCEDLLSMSPNFRLGPWTDFDNEEITRLADLTDYGNPDAWRGRTTVITGNSVLERGQRLDTLCPSVNVHWYPAINTGPMHEDRALEILNQMPQGTVGQKIVGIYPAADGPVKSWGFWNEIDWGRVSKALHEKYNCGFVLIGASFDKDLQARLAARFERLGLPFVRCVGENFGTAIEVIKMMSLFLGFPSGLTITGGILKVPTKWWLPPKTSGYASGGNVFNIGTNWLPADQTHFESRPMRKVEDELPEILKSPLVIKAMDKR